MSEIVSTAPVETPAVPATPAEGGTPAIAESAPAPKEGEQPEVKTGDTPEKRETPRWLQKQIDKATKRFYEQKARADFLAAELEKRPTQPTADPSAPTFESCGFDQAAFSEALSKYHKEKATTEVSQRQQTQTQAQTVQRIAAEWDKKSDKGAEKHPDFDQVVGNIEPTSHLAIAIMECENADEVAYFLGKNREEAQRIAQLPVPSQLREIGKLEAKLLATPAQPKAPPDLPIPIKPVGGASSPSTKKLSEMTQDEFEKRRRAQIAQRR